MIVFSQLLNKLCLFSYEYCIYYIDENTRIEYGYHITNGFSESYQLQRKVKNIFGFRWKKTAWTYEYWFEIEDWNSVKDFLFYAEKAETAKREKRKHWLREVFTFFKIAIIILCAGSCLLCNKPFQKDIAECELIPVADSTAHTGQIIMCLFSPDGSRIITFGSDSIAKIWDAKSGGLLYALQNTGYASYSADGEKIITTNRKGEVNIWSTACGNLLKSYAGICPIEGMAFYTDDGKNIITGIPDDDEDALPKLFGAETGNFIRAISRNEMREQLALNFHISFHENGEFENRVFSNDRKYFVQLEEAKQINIWDTKKNVQVLTLDKYNEAEWASFSPDGKLVAAGLFNGTLKIWETSSGKLVHEIKGKGESPC